MKSPSAIDRFMLLLVFIALTSPVFGAESFQARAFTLPAAVLMEAPPATTDERILSGMLRLRRQGQPLPLLSAIKGIVVPASDQDPRAIAAAITALKPDHPLLPVLYHELQSHYFGKKMHRSSLLFYRPAILDDPWYFRECGLMAASSQGYLGNTDASRAILSGLIRHFKGSPHASIPQLRLSALQHASGDAEGARRTIVSVYETSTGWVRQHAAVELALRYQRGEPLDTDLLNTLFMEIMTSAPQSARAMLSAGYSPPGDAKILWTAHQLDAAALLSVAGSSADPELLTRAARIFLSRKKFRDAHSVLNTIRRPDVTQRFLAASAAYRLGRISLADAARSADQSVPESLPLLREYAGREIGSGKIPQQALTILDSSGDKRLRSFALFWLWKQNPSAARLAELFTADPASYYAVRAIILANESIISEAAASAPDIRFAASFYRHRKCAGSLRPRETLPDTVYPENRIRSGDRERYREALAFYKGALIPPERIAWMEFFAGKRYGIPHLQVRGLHAALQFSGSITPAMLHRDYLESMFPRPWLPAVQEAAAVHGLAPSLIYSIMRTESRFDPLAESPAGALGLMQMLPGTARAYAAGKNAAQELFRIEFSIKAGSAHLKHLSDRCDAKPLLVAAAYNAGLTASRRWKSGSEDHDRYIERIGYAETADYVKAVYVAMASYSALYDAP
jgi:hypothetical protein